MFYYCVFASNSVVYIIFNKYACIFFVQGFNVHESGSGLESRRERERERDRREKRETERGREKERGRG